MASKPAPTAAAVAISPPVRGSAESALDSPGGELNLIPDTVGSFVAFVPDTVGFDVVLVAFVGSTVGGVWGGGV